MLEVAAGIYFVSLSSNLLLTYMQSRQHTSRGGAVSGILPCSKTGANQTCNSGLFATSADRAAFAPTGCPGTANPADPGNELDALSKPVDGCPHGVVPPPAGAAKGDLTGCPVGGNTPPAVLPNLPCPDGEAAGRGDAWKLPPPEGAPNPGAEAAGKGAA